MTPMSDPRFVHLRVHSEFSIADGIVRLDDVVKAAASDGQGALALTDLGNAFGLVRFYKEARGKGVKPIAGCDVWITNHDDRDKPARLLLLVKDRRGYLNLCELLTKAWLTNQYRGRAEVDAAWLEAGLAEGLLALSGAQQGDIGLAFAAGNDEAAKRHAGRWAKVFPNGFYIELQRCGQPGGEAYVQQAVALAAKLKLPVVATHPMQFMTDEEFTAHEARVCISEGDILANPRRQKRFTTAQRFRTQDEMVAAFADIPSAIANTVEIAKRCNLTLELGKPKLPLFPTPDGLSLDDYLVQLSKEGLEKRLVQLYPDEAERDRERARYYERLEFECGTIIKMGFPGYFLIVADFINWAKNNGVPVGPGRGSGAGSLVAYALGITDLDPLRYNLLFERFLNPERVSMPDFDIDFCQHGRDRVIQYVKDKYGADAVSQIATFGTMAAKAAVRDIGRVLDLGYNFTDGVAKLIPFKPGKHVTIADAMKEEPLLQERYDNEDEVHQLLDLAQLVEGLTRNVGMHAGGVLIAPGKLTDFCPLYTQGDESGVVSQYDKDDVEAVGLVKFDFLGLTTLTILDWAERYIRMLDPSKQDWSLMQVPLDDPASFSILKKANTVAVFQLESRGMQGMLKDAQPDRFEDIIALVALYRPGPMDLIPSFCARKHGREIVEYPDPRVEPVLKETYGIMVYQEQVMQMAQIIGGYSLGGADLLRRAMGKKKPEEMAQHREIFAEGAAKNGLSREKSDEIFDLMEKFAGYGFNKSHAAAYALLAYYTAWLKAHHPAEFMAANMSLAMDDTDKVKILFEDCIANGMQVLPPDINRSAYRFEPVAEAGAGEKKPRSRTIRYGLGAIKGSGQNAIEEILRAREDGPFKDLFDFCERIDRRIVNRRTVEAMIRAGAFDTLHENRAQLLASVPLAMEAAEQASANAMQAGLFDMGDAPLAAHELVGEPAWPEKRKLQEEKGALGFYLSGHLFDAYKDEVRRFVRQKIGDLKEGRDKLVAGVIASLRTQMTQRGKMLIALLDDGTGQCEVTVFNEQYEAHRQLFKEDELLVVQGQARNDAFTGGIRFTVDTVMDLERARSRYAQAVKVQMNGNANAQTLRSVLEAFRAKPDDTLPAPVAQTPSRGGRDGGGGYGRDRERAQPVIPNGLAVQIVYRNDRAEGEVRLGDAWRVKPTDDLLAALRGEFAGSSIEIVY
ncbi:DNA polymerase III subunit alpha [Paraburkholderia caballeronis]|uniref:DNA polymerase III subunit alpha n=1 Tax=Paraburkholderia caballeronis TaxID=416943 RepID=A0A1H7T632_9BURK|nr:DNA polymerase III subunit alpha [Paraburkholderia caballeronis]PXW22701.1 DNA polymerase III alpha subunit [Paraburkholderia caballeronis]PXW96804.1 DNA polymerase III alpha subunit [Paraburkholderia caballeronis]RAJ93431.1 DNA polymerase III alpha subunit [Paraburkholderia caballeronis]SEC71502.1 DNA polymerase III, alpha subunit [Paraburkholderia caballeronis]SEL80362.1 DNA polymerase III, alpha subunit [Paraburkholderia caballeronis]